MKENFITKLQTFKYSMGSFDAYLEESKELIKEYSNLSDEEVDDILKSMPSEYRAAIVDKDGYIGYIGLFDVDAQNNIASVRFETNKDLNREEVTEIVNEFKKYMAKSLNITKTDKFVFNSKDATYMEKKQLAPKSNIIISCDFLEPGISRETLEKFLESYSIPELQMPFTIKHDDKVIGIIGLSNIIWSNRRANLNIFLDKSLGSDVSNELSSFIIDDYINYVHAANIHNISLSVGGSDKNMLDIIRGTKMNYFGQIPFSVINGKSIESNFMFQHIPNMKKEKGIYIPDNEAVSLSLLDTKKKEMADQIDLGDGFKLMSPRAFESAGIDSSKILAGHIKAMQNRDRFSIPLGEDKYMLQKDTGIYGLSRALMNYSYVVLDEDNSYAGYINILRNNANGKNAEIEIGIDPKMQDQGLGTKVINRFYDELFSVGYASVTSSVFEFNNPSLRLHEKVAELNGIRLDSYYINGKLWDMSFYSKTNNLIKKKTSSKPE